MFSSVNQKSPAVSDSLDILTPIILRWIQFNLKKSNCPQMHLAEKVWSAPTLTRSTICFSKVTNHRSRAAHFSKKDDGNITDHSLDRTGMRRGVLPGIGYCKNGAPIQFSRFNHESVSIQHWNMKEYIIILEMCEKSENSPSTESSCFASPPHGERNPLWIAHSFPC